MDESVQPDWLTCSALDAISIHAYGTGDYATSAIQTYVQRAQAAGKKLLMEEWYVSYVTHPAFQLMIRLPRGACYYTTENNNCPSGSVLSSSQRNANIKAWASQITAAGLPWLYWQVIPNADPHVSPGSLFRYACVWSPSD